MSKKDDAASWNEQEIASLDADIERLSREQSLCEHQIKELREAEAPDQGLFYAQEIFHLQQEKLRLQVEVDRRRRKKNRLFLGMEE